MKVYTGTFKQVPAEGTILKPCRNFPSPGDYKFLSLSSEQGGSGTQETPLVPLILLVEPSGKERIYSSGWFFPLESFDVICKERI